jgi:hypothetical protein
MKTQLNEELNSIKYLFDYKRGKVISEQIITEENGQTVEEYPICVQKYGKPTFNGIIYSIDGKDDFVNHDFYNNYRVMTVDGMKDYYCSSDNKIVLGKNPTPVIMKGVVVKETPKTNNATNIQNKLVELGKESMLGSTGVDGKIGPNTINAIWDTIKDIKK